MKAENFEPYYSIVKAELCPQTAKASDYVNTEKTLSTYSDFTISSQAGSRQSQFHNVLSNLPHENSQESESNRGLDSVQNIKKLTYFT